MNIKKILKPFINPYTGPVFIITLILFYILFIYLPKISIENKTAYMTSKATLIINNLKDIRSYYTKNVIKKVKLDEHIKIDYDHEDKKNTIPLPATLVHDLSKIIPEDNMQIKMYSNYPFPNRKNRVLDNYEKESLAWLINNPHAVHTKTVMEDNKKYFVVSVADVFYDSSCVTCHNTRTDTPKNDWKAGDVRGVLQVKMPFKQEFILSNKQTIIILSIFVLLIVILSIHYALMALQRKKEHLAQEENLRKIVEDKTASLESSNKLLNEYKKAVDISAIVSKTDKRGFITYINEEFTKVSKYSQEELIGKSHNIVRHEDMSDEIFEDLWKTIKSKRIWKGNITNKAKDGSTYYVASTIVPILNYENEIEEFLAIRLDITDIVHAQIKAQRADTAKSTFLANMSHEVRTPLNAIIGFSDILSKSKSLDTQSSKQANIIQSSATSLLSIINDILDISKIESGNFDLSIEESDLYYINEHVVELFSKKAMEKHIKLVFNIDHKIPMCVKTDGLRLRQVISNLLSNAIKFTPNHGVVQLDIKLNKQIEDNKASIHFEVSDSGIGIPKEKLNSIFKPFIQVDHKSNREFQGTGLGLSICSHIISSLGSRIQIESEIGSGSKFFFDLEFETCNNTMHTNKDYLSHLNFIVPYQSNNLYLYIKKYLPIFGTINKKDATNNIYVYSCINKAHDTVKEFRAKYPNKPTLLLFDYDEDIGKFQLEENERAIALPFYASKLNDALQELKDCSKNIKEEIRSHEVQNAYEGKILVAEDNLANQELISYILQSLNVQFKIASNGQEVVDEYKINNDYDLILMDINMPILDGVKAFNKIREHEEQSSINKTPIIALTANAIKGDKEKFLNIGMDDYLSKPINTNELKEKFNKYLNMKIDSSSKASVSQNSKNEVLKLDLDAISEKIGVSQSIAKLIVNKFKNDMHNDLEEFEIIINSGNIIEINKKAHYIKNSCLNVNLTSVCELLQKLEDENIEHKQCKEIFYILKSQIENIQE